MGRHQKVGSMIIRNGEDKINNAGNEREVCYNASKLISHNKCVVVRLTSTDAKGEYNVRQL